MSHVFQPSALPAFPSSLWKWWFWRFWQRLGEGHGLDTGFTLPVSVHLAHLPLRQLPDVVILPGAPSGSSTRGLGWSGLDSGYILVSLMYLWRQ